MAERFVLVDRMDRRGFRRVRFGAENQPHRLSERHSGGALESRAIERHIKLIVISAWSDPRRSGFPLPAMRKLNMPSVSTITIDQGM